MIQHLEWDSKFFGLRIFKVNIDTKKTSPSEFKIIKSRLNELNADCAYLMLNEIDKDWSSFFYEQNVKCLDEKIVFQKQLQNIKPKTPDLNIESYESNLNSDLRMLGLESGKYSRFKLDEKLRNKFESLYDAWLENSLNRSIADSFLIYKKENQILGMITGKCHDDVATIGLFATHPNFQRQGVGKSLISMAEFSFQSKNIKTIQVATQSANIQACNFYRKCGYEILSITPIYHFWL